MWTRRSTAHFTDAREKCLGIPQNDGRYIILPCDLRGSRLLPGLVVDKYEDVLVVECLALGMEQFKETIVSLLKEELAKDGIKVRGVYERSDANERTKEGLPKVKGFIGEEFDTNVEIKETESVILSMS